MGSTVSKPQANNATFSQFLRRNFGQVPEIRQALYGASATAIFLAGYTYNAIKATTMVQYGASDTPKAIAVIVGTIGIVGIPYALANLTEAYSKFKRSQEPESSNSG